MTSTTSAVSFFHKASLGPKSGPNTSKPRLSVLKISETRGLKWKTGMQTTSSLNSTTFETDDHEDLKNKIFTEKQYMEFERKLNNPFEHTVGKNFGSGSFLPNSAIFRQHYSIKAYEIGATGKISLETLMNLFQETGINSVKGMGLEIDMMGSTPEMRKRNLVWVATKVQVAIDRYPLCEDVVQVDNWSTAIAGKNCMRRDAVIRDCKTRDVLVRVSSIWVTMNTKTRRVGRIPEEVREEVGPYLIDVPPILEDDDKKLVKLDEATAGYICPDLKPRRSDLDFNQHVNNAKYIGWILESVPRLLLEHHELSRITMEYKRECHKDNVLKSLTTVSSGSVKGGFTDPLDIECFHLLKLENGWEIMKARSEWRAKHANDLVNVV